MKYIKYDYQDFYDIIDSKKTFDEVAKKYGVSVHSIRCAMSRAKIFARKKMVLVTAPNKTIICNSINECAQVVGVSTPIISNALKGKHSRLLDELNVKVEVYKIKNAEEEYID